MSDEPGFDTDDPDYQEYLAFCAECCRSCAVCSEVPCPACCAGGICDQHCSCDDQLELFDEEKEENDDE